MRQSFFILISFTIYLHLSGQSYINDWKNFRNKKWNVVFETSSDSVFNVKTLGNLTFVNKVDKTLKISFEVISLSDRDSIFNANHQYYFDHQSCRPVSANSKSITSFDFKEFSYIYLGCRPTKRTDDCETLAQYIFKIREDKYHD